MFYRTEIERLPGESLASMADRLEDEAAMLKFRAGMLRHHAKTAGLVSMANDRPPVVILPVIPGGDIESDTENERVINHGRP